MILLIFWTGCWKLWRGWLGFDPYHGEGSEVRVHSVKLETAVGGSAPLGRLGDSEASIRLICLEKGHGRFCERDVHNGEWEWGLLAMVAGNVREWCL